MTEAKPIYKVIFINQNNVYEIYAKNVAQSNLLGFIEVEELIFGEKSSVVVDPGEERLKSEFTSVKRSYIPIHSIIRIDEVIKEGVAKVKDLGDKANNITPFPTGIYPAPKERL
ncbi:MAG: DUF1820 family protein [Gammaproteobacteria bacterium]|nr:DUF1820 family protein [Gammaproteobacteria bacterium]